MSGDMQLFGELQEASKAFMLHAADVQKRGLIYVIGTSLLVSPKGE